MSLVSIPNVDNAVRSILSTGGVVSAADACLIGEPSNVLITYDEVQKLYNNQIEWSKRIGNKLTFSTFDDLKDAGIVIVNKNNSTSSKDFAGKYVYIGDNLNLDAASDAIKIRSIKSFNTKQTSVSSFTTLSSANINFSLTAASEQDVNDDCLSERARNTYENDIGVSEFSDNLNIGCITLKQSPFSSSVRQLEYQYEESYNGSIDYFSQKYDQSGGPATGNYIETNVNENSTNLKVYVNNNVSRNTGTWQNDSGIPTKYIRVYDEDNSFIDDTERSVLQPYLTAINYLNESAPDVQNFVPATNLYNISKYQDRFKFSPLIGDVPAKLKTVFEKLDNDEGNHFDLVVEAGLGTIYTQSAGGTTDFKDSEYFDVSSLYSFEDQSQNNIVTNYKAVADEFTNFAKKGRKSLVVLDPLRSIFIQSENAKVINDTNKDFPSHIYWPLKHLYSNINTSFAATYGNWAKVYDELLNAGTYVPFSGFATERLASIDTASYPWTPVGGSSKGLISNVTDIALYPKQKHRDQLYQININPVMNDPIDGFIINGQKTLQQTPTAFDRINVRRAYLYLEKITKEVLNSFVFRPNNLATRNQVARVLTPLFEFAKTTKPQGIYDYKIVCDKSNNTPDIIDRNELIVDIFIQPVRAAEFVLVNFKVTRTGADFLSNL